MWTAGQGKPQPCHSKPHPEALPTELTG
uniref:Uncharacterized protein n=1 Tax=Anguilla anguilla TaxID=7936 RepID=A0A0E9XWV8_ANGAN